jgi:hypothetical protein
MYQLLVTRMEVPWCKPGLTETLQWKSEALQWVSEAFRKIERSADASRCKQQLSSQNCDRRIKSGNLLKGV